ncbi:MAG: MmgE/PrpD family protein [Pseudomonadota bacterium]
MSNDPIFDLARHVADTTLDKIPAPAITAAKTFILDTLGVGISGGTGPMTREVILSASTMGSGSDARVWGSGERLPANLAALCNAYQSHCQEFDCVHEDAVVHVMTVVLPAALAIAERQGGVSGARLLEAVNLGVDVAATLGVAARSGLRFFRPGTAGAFGGVAAIGKILGFDTALMVQAFSLTYGQVGGTMQAHTEGSGLLAMQMGFNARNAVMAADLAAAGFTGPENVLMGDFGYFRLIEDGGDPQAAIDELGKRWRISEVAHKPFPSGRATHGILDGGLALQRAHGFTADQIEEIRLTVPPLIQHLVGRPPKTEMAINYARLCARYVLACALHGDGVALSDFSPDAYRRPDRQRLAAAASISVEDRGDPNALTPVTVEILLKDGRSFSSTIEHVSGSPRNPLSKERHLNKFRQNCADGVRPVAENQVDALIELVDQLDGLPDVTRLVDQTLC